MNPMAASLQTASGSRTRRSERHEDEVWVASFPSGKLRRQGASDGAAGPHWCNQSELVYLAADRHFTAVPVSRLGGRDRTGDRVPLFRRGDIIRLERTLAPTLNNYAATADCSTFSRRDEARPMRSRPQSTSWSTGPRCSRDEYHTRGWSRRTWSSRHADPAGRASPAIPLVSCRRQPSRILPLAPS